MKKPRFLPFGVRLRTLLSLLLVAIISLSFVLIAFYNYNVEDLRVDVEAINISRVTQIKDLLDGELMGHHRLRQALVNDNVFLPLLRRGSQADLYEALVTFSQYLSYRGAGSSTAIWIADREQLFHQSGVSSGLDYYAQLMGVQPKSLDNMIPRPEDIPLTAGMMILPFSRKDGQQGLLCLYPLPAYTQTGMMLMVTLSPEEVTSLFQPLLNSLEGSAFLMNENGDLLFTTEASVEVNHQIKALVYDERYHVQSIRVDREAFSVVYAASPNAGLTYGVVVPENSYQTRVIKQTTLIWQIVLFALVLCIVVIVFLTMLHYRPVKALLELSGGVRGHFANEYEAIRSTMMQTRDQLELATNTLEMQKPYVLERLLGYILHSEIQPDQFQALFDGMDLRFDFPSFFVVCVRPIHNDSGKPGFSAFKETVIEIAKSIKSVDTRLYTLERMGDDTLVIVVNCRKAYDRQLCAQMLRQSLLERVDMRYGFVIGVGSVTERIEEVRNSLYEANILVENLADRPISFSEEIESLPGSFHKLYPVRELMLFLQQLRQGHRDASLASFEAICANISEGTGSQLIFRHVSAYIIRTVTETVEMLSGTRFEAQLSSMLHAGCMDSLALATRELIVDFCLFVSENKQSSNTRLRDGLLQYLNKNFCDPELSLERIAEVFDLSPYYISRFFRDQNNMNLKDYVAELRISRAKELLTHSGRSVSEIVNDVGYQSASTFIRKFKVTTGMTPGQYREQFGGLVK